MAAEQAGDHAVTFYEEDERLAAAVAGFLAPALASGGVAITVATPEHRDRFAAALGGAGVDLAAARASGRLIELDAAETLAQLMYGPSPDGGAFDRIVGGTVRRAAQLGRPVHAYGEMVALLWQAGNVMAAIELEELWNELGWDVPFRLLCAYPSAALAGADPADLAHVCHVHSALVGAGPEAEAARRFALAPDSPILARRFVAETMAEWGLTGAIDEAALVATELVTNAVVHAQSDFVVVLARRPSTLWMGVRDRSSEPPLPVGVSDGVSGRGLRLIDALTVRWGHDSGRDGKLVWAELAL